MAKILVVDDDIGLADRIKEWLTHQNFTVEAVNEGSDAQQLLANFDYDLIVLDWTLPDTTGPEICRRFRQNGGKTPVLFLTGRGDIESKEVGLEAGGDDYLVKPFDLRELTARIKAIVRRNSQLTSNVIQLGDFVLEVGQKRLLKATKTIQLTAKEYAVMEFLMRNPNCHFTSQALLKKVWTADKEASEDSVRTLVKGLRRKITEEGEECIIKTVHGLGYVIETPPVPTNTQTGTAHK